ncbi:PTS sugar transporter subunit IIA [Liquorilactobacillus ghanensis]|uniref:PTS sugar transporter subunit IIA n=1 Tax=Liquorilactobacillus ghanensis TaxID=399370 RepID=UPI0039E7C420
MQNVFSEENIKIISQVDNWQKAVEIACQPLLEEKKITQKYVTNIIKSVKKYGPYMVLTDYFALMHAKPGEGVNQLAMSLLVVKEPIDLEGKKVKIFLILACPDSKSHIKTLKEVAGVLMDQCNFELILKGTKSQIIDLFQKKEMDGGKK